jgi:uncharacterized protein YndB with AHSA1/START domain
MPAQSTSKQSAPEREIIVTRVFDAPREMVWDAWTDPNKVSKWWGPKGFSTTIKEMDLRTGGRWSHVMHGPDGTDYPNESVFKEVVKPERIVYQHEGGKQDGRRIGFTSTWTFDKEPGNKTRLTIHMVFETAEAREFVVKEHRAIEGGNQTLGRLAEFLAASSSTPSETFVISRTFNAPRDLVFKAFTEADRLGRWFGPTGFTMVSTKVDLRPGGLFHYCMRAPNGQEMWGKFEYREIAPPERLVFASSFSDPQGNTIRAPFSSEFPLQILNTITFADQDKTQTVVNMHGVPLNATEAERQFFANMHPSMQQGWSGTFAQLDEYLATL